MALAPVDEEPIFRGDARIVVPETSRVQGNVCRVLALSRPLENLKAGDTVLISEFGGTRIPRRDGDVIIAREEAVLALVEGEKLTD